jgi:hypothetical protein
MRQARDGEHGEADTKAFEKDTPDAASRSIPGVLNCGVHFGWRIWSTMMTRTLGRFSLPTALVPSAAPAVATAPVCKNSRLFISNLP